MSRWFRHYAGMMRDEKLVRAAVRAKQPVERVVWVWGAILESAAEIDNAGHYEFDAGEAAYFLRADEADIRAIEDALADAGRVAEGRVVKWARFRVDYRPAVPIAVRQAVFARDGAQCRYCGGSADSFHLDHILPWSRGGQHTLENLVVACAPCNRAKRDKTPSEWLQ